MQLETLLLMSALSSPPPRPTITSLKGRFFYRMNKTALPQWIRAFPEESSPRTGDGVFPGDAIEVSQVGVRMT